MTGMYAGVKELTFDSWFEFCSWKEKEEEQTHTYYTTEKRYQPSYNKDCKQPAESQRIVWY